MKTNNIEILADIRSYPASTRQPQFNKPVLEAALTRQHITYIHLPALGGKGKNVPSHTDTSIPFIGYRSYMKTPEFQNGIIQMQQMAARATLAYMCAEADWKNCHRAFVSDYLKSAGWKVIHVLRQNILEEHPHRYIQGNLFLND